MPFYTLRLRGKKFVMVTATTNAPILDEKGNPIVFSDKYKALKTVRARNKKRGNHNK